MRWAHLFAGIRILGARCCVLGTVIISAAIVRHPKAAGRKAVTVDIASLNAQAELVGATFNIDSGGLGWG